MRCKLNLGFLVAILLLWAICVITIWNGTRVQEVFTDLQSDIVPAAITMSEMKYTATGIRHWTLTYIIRGNAIRSGRPIKEWLQEDWAALEKAAREHIEHEWRFGFEERRDAQTIVDLSRRLISVSAEIVELKDQGAGNDELFEKVRLEFGAPIFYPLRELLDEHTATHLEQLSAAGEDVRNRHVTNTRYALILALAATFVAILVGWSVDRLFVRYTAERRRSEEALQKAHDELDMRVKVRTAELVKANEKLENEISQRKLAGEALQQSEERFRELFDNMSSGVAVYEAKDDGNDFIFKDFNRGGEGIDNIKKGDLIGKSVLEVFPGLREFGLFDVFQRVWKTGKPEHHPISQYKDDRIVGWRENYVYKLPSGEVVAVYDNVTERKQAEERVRLLSSAVEQSSEGIALVDLEGNVLFANNAFASMHGYTQDELIGKHLSVFHTPEQMPSVEAANRQIGETGEFNGEIWHVHRDGSVFPTLMHNSMLRDETGTPIGIIGTLRDITDRKRAEQALQQSEERFRTVFETAEDSIFIKNRDLEYIHVNPAMERLFETPASELIGRTDVELFGLETGEQIKEVDARVLAGEIIQEEQSKPVKGVLHTFQAIKVPMRNTSGEIVGLCGIARDITEVRMMQDELAKADKLESVGLLAGGIAHDFNNILTAILGNISLAQMDIDSNDEAFEKLAEAEKATMRARDLTQQLLTFSKGGTPVKKMASVVEILRDCVGFALRGSNIRCELSLPDDLCQVEVDQGQIGQVIHNLIVNADQAMPEGGTIFMRAENTPVKQEDTVPLIPGKYVKITVKDQGVGIPEEYLPKIFDPFFTTKKKGSGLGLATCYSIIRNHDGHIEVESASGQGTTFRVYLPVSDKVTAVTETTEETPASGKGKVLLMDDEKSVRNLVRKALGRLGYDVDVVKDGLETIELYKKARESGEAYDAVILDLTIPGGMGGREVIKILREIDPRVKAIVSSGYSNDPVMANYKEHGFDGVVAKPYRLHDLARVMHDLLCTSRTPVAGADIPAVE